MRLSHRVALTVAAGGAAVAAVIWCADALLSTAPLVSANTYSTGCRAGTLTKYSPRGWFWRTGEGELMLGRNAAQPWRFSSTVDVYEASRRYAGQHVAVCYRQLSLQPHSLNGDTDYRALTLLPVDPELAPTACQDPSYSPGSRSLLNRSDEGFRSGTLVKASLRGTVSSTYEVSLQPGDGVAQPIDMSITDAPLYACAMRFVRSGRPVTVTYDDSPVRNPLARDSSLRILAIVPSQ